MTEYSLANLDAWVAKVQSRADAVLKQAVNDLIVNIDIKTGITRGGTFERGVIPRDLGALAGSLRSELLGSTSLSNEGEDSFVLAIGQMQAGDTARFTWGGANAPYARAIHYGSGSYPGTFWRDDAAAKWQGYVKAATIRAKAQIP